MRRAVIDLAASRRVWRAPDQTVEAVRSAFGRGWEVVVVTVATDSDGDGGGGSPEARRAAESSEVYVGWGVSAGVARAATGSLRWAHTAAAGAAASVTPALRATGAVLTNSRGVYAEPIADWVVAALAFSLRGFHATVSAQREGRWTKDRFSDGGVRVTELAGTHVGLVGLGGIGTAVVRRCAALGMLLRAVRRHPARRRPRGVDWVGGPDELEALAEWSDVLVVAAPHTAETEHLVGEDVLARLPAHAFVINVGRGALVDEEALLRRLDAGALAGCALDVFAMEPLPPDHPFWAHPRVLVSPHVSGISDRFWERQTGLLVENVDRYLHGRRLKNVVDLEAGY